MINRFRKQSGQRRNGASKRGPAFFLLAAMVPVVLLFLGSQTAYAGNYSYGLPEVKPEKVGMSSARLKKINTAMASFIDTKQVPGLITVVARHGKVVHFSAQGYADAEAKKRLKPDTIFRLYSMSKPVTGVAVMMLYEEGRFGLDDPVADYLPEFKQAQVYTDQGMVDTVHPITIRHLLTHTAGLIYVYAPSVPAVGEFYRKANIRGNRAMMTSGITLEDYVKKIAAQPLAFQPGTQWEYGVAMDVLARLVEVVSGQRYSDFVRRRIFVPLAMKDTDFYVPPGKQDRLAVLYKIGKNKEFTINDFDQEYTQPPSMDLGGTGLVGTAADYLRFAQMLLNGGELDGVRLLSPTTVKLMRSNHLPAQLGDMPLANLDYPITKRKGMGFGLTMAVVTDTVAAGIAGGDGIYTWGGAASTDFWIDPEYDLIGMVFTQLMPSGIYPTRKRMQQVTYQALVK